MSEKKNHLVEFVGEEVVPISGNETILDASLAAGIQHFHVCGGNAKCSTCRVLVIEGADRLTPPNSKEIFLNNQMHFPPNVRLACQTHVTKGNVKLKRIIQDVSDIGLYVGTAAGDSTQQLGEERVMALLFLDIRDFTRIVETHPAFDVIHIIRKLFTSFQSIIEFENGKVVETTGDGLYAVFNHDKEKKRNAQSSLKAALSMINDLETLNETYFIPFFEERVEAGIGIHIGKVVSGSVKVGLENHWVVMGYAVNIASRLQTATKELNNNVVVSADIYDLTNHSAVSKPQTIALKGVTNPLMVYAIGKPFIIKTNTST